MSWFEPRQRGLTMNESTIISDQLYNWSENEPSRFRCCAAPTTSSSGQATGPARTVHSPRILDLTLQTLWQSWLQVCPGSRSWAQVLFVDQPARRSAADGLRANGVHSTGLRVPPQLPASASTAGADLQPQSRVITAPGEVLTFNEHGAFGTRRTRFGYGRDSRRQLFAKLAKSQRPASRSSN
jgi:hypothetical protein